MQWHKNINLIVPQMCETLSHIYQYSWGWRMLHYT